MAPRRPRLVRARRADGRDDALDVRLAHGRAAPRGLRPRWAPRPRLLGAGRAEDPRLVHARRLGGPGDRGAPGRDPHLREHVLTMRIVAHADDLGASKGVTE